MGLSKEWNNLDEWEPRPLSQSQLNVLHVTFIVLFLLHAAWSGWVGLSLR